MDKFQDIRSDMVLAMESVGIRVEVHHHEVASGGQTLWVQFVFHRYCDAHCGAYTIQPAKFTSLLDFLQAQEGQNLVTVLTTAQAMALS